MSMECFIPAISAATPERQQHSLKQLQRPGVRPCPCGPEGSDKSWRLAEPFVFKGEI
jgi:hypothetical protein